MGDLTPGGGQAADAVVIDVCYDRVGGRAARGSGAQAADAAMLDVCQIVVRGRTLRGRVAARVIASLHGMDRSGK